MHVIDTADARRHVVDGALGNLRIDSELRQPSSHRSPKVVQNPMRHGNDVRPLPVFSLLPAGLQDLGVQTTFSFLEFSEGLIPAAARCEKVLPVLLGGGPQQWL